MTTPLRSWVDERAVRLDPGRRGLLALGLVAAAVAVAAGVWVAAARPQHAGSVPVTVLSTGAATPASGTGGSLASPASTVRSAGPQAAAAVLVVDVVGKVRRPGVYRLAAGARVDDAVAAAGGVLPGVDLTTLNLARRVADGELVAVGLSAAVAGANGAIPAAGVGTGAEAGAGSSAGTPLDLNSATVAQLDALPGVGPVLAQRILDWRTAHGRFDSVDQLRSVTGIGAAKFSDLRPLVTVS